MTSKKNNKLKICRRQPEMAVSIEYQIVILQSETQNHKKNQSEATNKNCTRRRGEDRGSIREMQDESSNPRR